jgi:hypothetical protein
VNREDSNERHSDVQDELSVLDIRVVNSVLDS